MMSSEELVNAIHREMGSKRSETTTAHVFSKEEMKNVLLYMVDLRNKLNEAETSKLERDSIVEEVLQKIQSENEAS